MLERGALRLADVMENRACSGDGQRMAFEPVAGERGHAKLLGDEPRAVLRREHPVVERRACRRGSHAGRGRGGRKGVRGG